MWHQIVQYLHLLINSPEIIKTGGLTVLLIIVFSETGLFVGFFLPGDYMLALAGIWSATGQFPWPLQILLPLVMGAAWLGNTVGFYTGRFMGPRLFNKEDSLFFKRKYLIQTKDFYDHYGASMLIFGRFFPYVRTFAPIMAGAIQMPFKKFNTYNIIGAVAWVGSIITTGFVMAKLFPEIANHVDYIIYGFLGLTSIGLLVGFIRSRRKNKEEK